MKLVLGILVVMPLVLLIVATIRGQVQMRSCCAVPPEQDGRLASAYAPTSTGDKAHDAEIHVPGAAAH